MTTAAQPVLRLESLGKTYPGGTRALHEVSLTVAQDEFIAIIGRSGAGKSTLLRCVNRLIDPTAGRIVLEDRDVTRAAGRRLRSVRQRIAMIFQQFNLVGRLSVLENVLTGRLRFNRGVASLPPALVRWFPARDRYIAFECLDRVGILEQAYKRADQLSGGQQQRVAIARTLAQEARMILADEPIASLDPRSSSAVMDALRDIHRKQGIPVMVNLHQVDVARKYATRVLGMRDGRVVFDGTPDALTEQAIPEIYDGMPPEEDSPDPQPASPVTAAAE